jgi:hypothetical protein
MKSEPRRIYPIGATHQPHERVLEMTTVHLRTLRDTAASIAGKPGVHRFADFVIYNEPSQRDLKRLVAHGNAHRILASVFRR